MIRRLIPLLSAIWPVALLAGPLPEAQVNLFLDFAADVSGQDADLMAQARALTQTPPTSKEEIGFYGLDNAPEAERALRGIISLLSNANHLITVEDKYVYELPEILESFDAATLPADRSDVSLTAPFENTDWDAGPTDEEWQAFKGWFPAHVRAIEAAVERNDLTLLSVQFPLGDTLYFWAAPPELARKWQDRALYAGVNTLKFAQSPLVSISVTEPDWATYWGFATYALRIPEAYWTPPEGL